MIIVLGVCIQNFVSLIILLYVHTYKHTIFQNWFEGIPSSATHILLIFVEFLVDLDGKAPILQTFH